MTHCQWRITENCEYVGSCKHTKCIQTKLRSDANLKSFIINISWVYHLKGVYKPYILHLKFFVILTLLRITVAYVEIFNFEVTAFLSQLSAFQKTDINLDRTTFFTKKGLHHVSGRFHLPHQICWLNRNMYISKNLNTKIRYDVSLS